MPEWVRSKKPKLLGKETAGGRTEREDQEGEKKYA